MSSRIHGKGRLKAQRVDWVASLLMAAFILVGSIVLLLFVYWLTTAINWQRSGSIEVSEERIAGRGDHAAGFARDVEPPGADEVVELASPEIESSLEAVTEFASSVTASFDSVSSESMATAAGAGRGDSRPPGPLGEGDDMVPRHERWELKFRSSSLKEYASQLDYYKIELATIGGGVTTVDYASNLSTRPATRSGSSEDENQLRRLYFMWRSDNPLKRYDSQLLEQAGVRTQGRQLLKFIPKELENQLAQLELEYARNQTPRRDSVREIAKTLFESQPKNNGYEFVVLEQFYRTVGK